MMRLPRFRFTVRRLMVAVTILALGLAMYGGARTRDQRRHAHDQSTQLGLLARTARTEAARLPVGDPEKRRVYCLLISAQKEAEASECRYGLRRPSMSQLWEPKIIMDNLGPGLPVELADRLGPVFRFQFAVRMRVVMVRERWAEVQFLAEAWRKWRKAEALDRESEVYARMADEATPLSASDAAALARWSSVVEVRRAALLREAATLEAKAKS